MAIAPGLDQKFTIVKAIVDTGKETIEIGEKILEQVQGELGDLALFQSDHDACLTTLVESAKTIAMDQQCLTSKVLTNSWDKKQHHLWLANLKENLKKMQDEFNAGENAYFVIQEEVSALKTKLRTEQQRLALRKQSTPKPVTRMASVSNPTATPRHVISKPSLPMLTTPVTSTPRNVISKPATSTLTTPMTSTPKSSILKPTTPKRTGKRQAPPQSPPPKKLPLRRIDPNKTMDTVYDDDEDDENYNFWND
uniref:BLOC-1-related complex subunit 5 n=1 Tax=Meloidogyne hapla TaxID=6305 RepID=A0A1I8B7X2_MELHA